MIKAIQDFIGNPKDVDGLCTASNERRRPSSRRPSADHWGRCSAPQHPTARRTTAAAAVHPPHRPRRAPRHTRPARHRHRLGPHPRLHRALLHLLDGVGDIHGWAATTTRTCSRTTRRSGARRPPQRSLWLLFLGLIATLFGLFLARLLTVDVQPLLPVRDLPAGRALARHRRLHRPADPDHQGVVNTILNNHENRSTGSAMRTSTSG